MLVLSYNKFTIKRNNYFIRIVLNEELLNLRPMTQETENTNNGFCIRVSLAKKWGIRDLKARWLMIPRACAKFCWQLNKSGSGSLFYFPLFDVTKVVVGFKKLCKITNIFILHLLCKINQSITFTQSCI